MKKALSVFLMAAMAFGAFADEPVADVNVAEFSGNAAVTWGVDLDSGKTGFKNTSRVDLKLNLLNNGTKSTTGDGVWGELVLKVDGDTFIQWRHDNNAYGDGAFGPSKGMAGTYENGGHGFFFKKIYVDKAQINFGPAYVGIKTGNTTVGQLKLDAAVSANRAWLNDVGASKTQGIVVGFDSDIVKVDVDVRSESYDAQYSNDYGIAAEAELKAVENLSVKAGVSYEFKENGKLGYAASAGYKLALDDTFYVRPQVGITGEKDADPIMAAGVLFGWGEMADANAGVYFLGGDAAKKVTPGVSVLAKIPLAENSPITIQPSVYSGELIPGLTAAAIADIVIPGVEGADTEVGVAFGAKYAVAVDALTITPKAGVAFATTEGQATDGQNGTVTNNIEAATNVLQVKAGVDVAGLIDNTTLSVEWVSGDLVTDLLESEAGTLNFTAKIAL